MIVNFKKSIKNAKIILVTMHRRENIDFFGDMCDAIIDISKKYVDNAMVILPVHLNPNVKNVVTKKLFGIKNVKIVNPIPYDVFPHVILESHVIMTDSGGIQEEASSIGKPVILMRATTERPEGTFQGSIKQIGTNRQEIIDACTEAISMNKAELSSNLFGDGQASVRIAENNKFASNECE
ncbi:hypothetical protein AKO1_013912 [Acrasis kona]|uniref:UDP-N-acetylglucosamine 2-epimerase (non-hydrolyzing) n=1 Tax=Acrasis kona TaxID=1008807 RepID=A0AAW2Z4H9_9EUKA